MVQFAFFRARMLLCTSVVISADILRCMPASRRMKTGEGGLRKILRNGGRERKLGQAEPVLAVGSSCLLDCKAFLS